MLVKVLEGHNIGDLLFSTGIPGGVGSTGGCVAAGVQPHGIWGYCS